MTYIIPVSNAWPERGGSATKRIKTNKRSILKDDALNALLLISLDGPQLGTIEAKELVKNIWRAIQYKKSNTKKHLVLHKKSKRHKLIKTHPSEHHLGVF